MQKNRETSAQDQINQFPLQSRARAIIEFPGRRSEPITDCVPVTGSSQEQDEELRREIIKGWSHD